MRVCIEIVDADEVSLDDEFRELPAFRVFDILLENCYHCYSIITEIHGTHCYSILGHVEFIKRTMNRLAWLLVFSFSSFFFSIKM